MKSVHALTDKKFDSTDMSKFHPADIDLERMHRVKDQGELDTMIHQIRTIHGSEPSYKVIGITVHTASEDRKYCQWT